MTHYGSFGAKASPRTLPTMPTGRGAPATVLSMSLTRRLQVLVDPERHAALEREAARTGRSVGAVVREALDERLGLTAPHAHGAGARLLAAPPAPVGEPDGLAAERRLPVIG